MSDYKQDLLANLKIQRYAAKYLTACAEDSDEAFLIALRDVAEAHSGMTKLASDAGVNRENLYRILSGEGNPRLSSLSSILKALGMQLAIRPIGDNEPISVPPDKAPEKAIQGPSSSPRLGKTVSEAFPGTMGNLNLSKMLGLSNVASHVPNIGSTVAEALAPMRASLSSMAAMATSLNFASTFAEMNKQMAALNETLAAPARQSLATITAAQTEWMKNISGMDDREPEADQSLEFNERSRPQLVSRREPSGINPTSRPETQFRKCA